MKTKIVLAVVALLVIIQFFRIDKSNPQSNPQDDILIVENVPNDIGMILKTSCYDCHSNATTYPWYSNIAPVSWWLKHHVDEGREELNFSVWATYSAKRKDHKLEEVDELVEKDEMPMPSYLWMHGDAKLTEQQKNQLMNWAKSLRKGEKVEEL